MITSGRSGGGARRARAPRVDLVAISSARGAREIEIATRSRSTRDRARRRARTRRSPYPSPSPSPPPPVHTPTLTLTLTLQREGRRWRRDRGSTVAPHARWPPWWGGKAAEQLDDDLSEAGVAEAQQGVVEMGGSLSQQASRDGSFGDGEGGRANQPEQRAAAWWARLSPFALGLASLSPTKPNGGEEGGDSLNSSGRGGEVPPERWSWSSTPPVSADSEQRAGRAQCCWPNPDPNTNPDPDPNPNPNPEPNPDPNLEQRAQQAEQR